jgi:hypothetical protein
VTKAIDTAEKMEQRHAQDQEDNKEVKDIEEDVIKEDIKEKEIVTKDNKTKESNKDTIGA